MNLSLIEKALRLLIVFLMWHPSLRGQSHDPPAGLAKSLLENKTLAFSTVERGNLRFHYHTGSYASAHLASAENDAENAVQTGLAILNEHEFTKPLDIFYLESREEMFRIMGMRVKGYADWRSRTVLLVFSRDIRAYHTHEIMHVLSTNLWGYPALSNHCFLEGLAVFADSPCLGYSLHEIAAYLMHNELLIPFDGLLYGFRQQEDMPSYMEAGSLIEYLIASYGLEKFKRIWKEGLPATKEVLGIDTQRLEEDYKKFLGSRYKETPEVDWNMLLDRGCG